MKSEIQMLLVMQPTCVTKQVQWVNPGKTSEYFHVKGAMMNHTILCFQKVEKGGGTRPSIHFHTEVTTCRAFFQNYLHVGSLAHTSPELSNGIYHAYIQSLTGPAPL